MCEVPGRPAEVVADGDVAATGDTVAPALERRPPGVAPDVDGHSCAVALALKRGALGVRPRLNSPPRRSRRGGRRPRLNPKPGLGDCCQNHRQLEPLGYRAGDRAGAPGPAEDAQAGGGYDEVVNLLADGVLLPALRGRRARHPRALGRLAIVCGLAARLRRGGLVGGRGRWTPWPRREGKAGASEDLPDAEDVTATAGGIDPGLGPGPDRPRPRRGSEPTRLALAARPLTPTTGGRGTWSPVDPTDNLLSVVKGAVGILQRKPASTRSGPAPREVVVDTCSEVLASGGLAGPDLLGRARLSGCLLLAEAEASEPPRPRGIASPRRGQALVAGAR